MSRPKCCLKGNRGRPVAYDVGVPTRADGQPAFGALFVPTLTGGRICAATASTAACSHATRPRAEGASGRGSPEGGDRKEVVGVPPGL